MEVGAAYRNWQRDQSIIVGWQILWARGRMCIGGGGEVRVKTGMGTEVEGGMEVKEQSQKVFLSNRTIS